MRNDDTWTIILGIIAAICVGITAYFGVKAKKHEYSAKYWQRIATDHENEKKVKLMMAAKRNSGSVAVMK